MPSLQSMALVDLGDGKGSRHIPGVTWCPGTKLYDAYMTDPHGRRIYLGGFEEPRRAAEAIESMTATFAKHGAMGSTIIGGPRPTPDTPPAE